MLCSALLAHIRFKKLLEVSSPGLDAEEFTANWLDGMKTFIEFETEM